MPGGLALVAATYGLVRLATGLYLPDVQDDLGLGTAAAGLVSSGASLAYCLGALLGLVLATRRARALVVVAALTAGGGALGLSVAPDRATFAVLTVLASVGTGVVSPALVEILRRDPVVAGDPSAQSTVNAGTGPGLVVAGALALTLLPDWRAAWAWSGLLTLAVAALVLLAAQGGETGRQAPGATLPRSWWSAHRRVVAASLLLGSGSAAVWSYGRVVVLEAGGGTTASVVAWIALGLGGTAVVATAAPLGRRAPRTAWTLTAGVTALATLALGLGSGSAVVAVAACAVFGWGFVAATGALIAWTLDVDPGRGAAGTALLFVVLVLGQALGSALSGALMHGGGHGAAFAASAFLTAVGAVVAAPVRVRRLRVADAATRGRPRAARGPSRPSA